ncbi:hypothetical protein B0H11DRAFT_1916051 [Mycena galericulata]|nr:hypothetical protein B0H11DRAFT_1916051 [Mycena galericulata]
MGGREGFPDTREGAVIWVVSWEVAESTVSSNRIHAGVLQVAGPVLPENDGVRFIGGYITATGVDFEEARVGRAMCEDKDFKERGASIGQASDVEGDQSRDDGDVPSSEQISKYPWYRLRYVPGLRITIANPDRSAVIPGSRPLMGSCEPKKFNPDRSGNFRF